jgi:hypothetical protein
LNSAASVGSRYFAGNSRSVGFGTTEVLGQVLLYKAVGCTPSWGVTLKRLLGVEHADGSGATLVAGGWFSSVAELYDPATGTWTTTGSLSVARRGPTATLLPNGQVLVAGGVFGAYLASAELYDPATGLWTPTGNIAMGRTLHTATLLPNGQVLVAGGFNHGTAPRPAELYDPATGTWTITDTLDPARWSHTATLLHNGRVLVSGGRTRGGGVGVLSSAELYKSAPEVLDTQ